MNVENDNRDGDIINKEKLPRIFDGEFFIFKSKIGDKIVAECKLCGQSRIGSVGSTGNFLCHIKRMHSSMFIKCKQHIENKQNKQLANSTQLVSSKLVHFFISIFLNTLVYTSMFNILLKVLLVSIIYKNH